MEYCCEQFEKARETLNIGYDEKRDYYWLDGYDMVGPYPDLNYCPNCGTKVKKNDK